VIGAVNGAAGAGFSLALMCDLRIAAAEAFFVVAYGRIGDSLEHSLTDHLQLERHGIADSMATEDLRHGVTAFKAGEKPEFEGD